MKLPLMLPEYLCGECRIEMLLVSKPYRDGPFGPTVTVACHTMQCPQKGVRYDVVLQCAPVPDKPAEDSVAT